MKILATTLGETFADMISMIMGEGYSNSAAILFGIFLHAGHPAFHHEILRARVLVGHHVH